MKTKNYSVSFRLKDGKTIITDVSALNQFEAQRIVRNSHQNVVCFGFVKEKKG